MGLFRRKDPLDADGAAPEEERTKSAVDAAAATKDHASSPYGGPFDAEEVDDQLERINFGSVLVPAIDGMQIRVELDEAENVVAVSVLVDESVLQLQAFAASRSEGLWNDVRQEIAEGVRASSGRAREAEGPFGRELHATVSVQPAEGVTQNQEVRFVGADGPRWFLRGLISGPAAIDPARAGAIEEVFGKVAVERGSHAAPPREPLPLTVPASPNLVPEDAADPSDPAAPSAGE